MLKDFCMYSTAVYFYTPRHTVVLSHDDSIRRYQSVYAKNLTLHKGVTNRVQIQFLNQDQKPVNLIGSEITFRVLSEDGSKLLLSSLLSLNPDDGSLPITGIAVLQLPHTALNTINKQLCKYTIEFKGAPSTTPGSPVFTNDHSAARGTVEIVDSVLPNFVPSQSITIPSHQYPTMGNEVTYYSSIFSPNNNVFSMQVGYENYTGSMTLQASTTQQGDWYDVSDPYVYDNLTDTLGYTNLNFGIHPFYRLQFISTSGDTQNVLVR